LRFTAYDAAVGGSSVGGPVTNSPVAVSNGLFTATVDLGNLPFATGASRWLEVAVRTNGAGAFTPLTPRQQFTATPYAITARHVTGAVQSSALAGTYTNAVTFNNAANNFSGNGAGLIGVNAASLGGLNAGQFWKLTGNNVSFGQFLGSTNNRPLELRANNEVVLRLMPNPGNPPDVLGGSILNFIAPGSYGSTISGGNQNSIDVIATNSTVSGGENNSIGSTAVASTISGGLANAIQSDVRAGTIGGGEGNRILANSVNGTVGGGVGNWIESAAPSATIAGGQGNIVVSGAQAAVIGGGHQNAVANSTNATIGGGLLNQAAANYSTIAGGGLNSIEPNAWDGAIAGGFQNTIQSGATEATIGGGQSNTIETNSNYSVIAGGIQNRVQINTSFGTIGGGQENVVHSNAMGSTISGGRFNKIHTNASSSTIGGGYENVIRLGCERSVIGGGYQNVISNSAIAAVVPGGLQNHAAASHSFAAGRAARALHHGAFVWSSSAGGIVTSSAANDSVTFRAPGGYRFFTDIGGTGAQLLPNANAWSIMSDRNAKKNIQPLNYGALLDKLSRVPIQQWKYKWEPDDGAPHLGPMAQDFKRAFYPGRDDKNISTLEFDGVELAAIQALNQKLNEKDNEIRQLKERLDRLEAFVTQIPGAKLVSSRAGQRN
jgi:hypothetical protein